MLIIDLGCRLLGTSSDLPGSDPSPSARDKSLTKRLGARRATSSSLLGLALEWGLPSPMLPPDRVVSYTTFSPLLRRMPGRSFFCGTFRPFRSLGLRGTLPWRARTFLPGFCWDRGLTPVPTFIGAIIYSALANLTHFFNLIVNTPDLSNKDMLSFSLEIHSAYSDRCAHPKVHRIKLLGYLILTAF